MLVLRWVGWIVGGALLGAAGGFGAGVFFVLVLEPKHSGNMSDGAIPIMFGMGGLFLGPIVALVVLLLRRGRRPRGQFG